SITYNLMQIMLLMMESLILFRKENIHTLYIPRTKKKYIHGFLQFLSTVLITVGIAFRIKTKSGEHFNTTHGILGKSKLKFKKSKTEFVLLGLVAWILMWISIFLGLATSQSQLLKNIVKPVWIKLCHTLIGISGFTLGVVCLGYGMKNYLAYVSNENVMVAAI